MCLGDCETIPRPDYGLDCDGTPGPCRALSPHPSQRFSPMRGQPQRFTLRAVFWGWPYLCSSWGSSELVSHCHALPCPAHGTPAPNSHPHGRARLALLLGFQGGEMDRPKSWLPCWSLSTSTCSLISAALGWSLAPGTAVGNLGLWVRSGPSL